MNDTLPPFTPDWNNPQPSDAPTPEDTQMFARLQNRADGIKAWLATAYLHPPTINDWQRLTGDLIDLADRCVQHLDQKARTVDPRDEQ